MKKLISKLKEWTGRELTGVEMQDCNRAKESEYHVFGASSDNYQQKIYSASGCGAYKTFRIQTINYEKQVEESSEVRAYDCNGRLTKRKITKIVYLNLLPFSHNPITLTRIKNKIILYNPAGSFFGTKVKENKK